MHDTVVEEWSRGSSPIHRRAAAAKLIPVVMTLVLLATAHRRLEWFAGGLALLLAGGVLLAGLPLRGAMLRAAAVLPFTALFAAISWVGGDSPRAVELVVKSYLSAWTVLLLVGTTPLPDLVRSLELVKAPRFLLTVVQFLYRYLFVVLEEASHMRAAAGARGGMTFRAAAGVLAVLFARSYARAEGIHRAMLARGFEGRFHPLAARAFTLRDAQFAGIAIVLPVLLRAASEGLFR